MVNIIAHRGASAHYHENTISSFKAAIDNGADGIELDIQLAASGEAIVIHDDSLERTTNGYGAVGGYELAQLLEYDAGGGESIPTLDKVLGSFHSRNTRFWIELKKERSAKVVAALISSYVSTGRYSHEQLIVISSLHSALREVISINPNIVTGATLYQKPESLSEILEFTGADFILPEWHIVDEALMKDAKQNKVEVVSWTINDEITARRITEMGAYGIITDDPKLLKSYGL